MQNSRARIPPPQRDCGGWDALVRARAARLPAPPTLPRLCPEEEASSHATPHAAPLKRGEDALAPTRPHNPRTHGREVMPCNAVPRYVMICYDMPCEAVLCSATLCYDVLLGESASLRDWSSDARVARGGCAVRLGRYATSATVERSA